jgi:predicted nuclease of predicted toxin-antitoxin system
VKLLFDQNISYKIVAKLINVFPDSIHVREAGLEGHSDKQIWEYARNNSFSVLTFDADYIVMSTVFGHPPKIIWLRIGNSSTESLRNFLEAHSDLIKEFITSTNYSEVSCLELG